MRKLIFITLIFNSIFVFSQTKKDSLLTELKTKTVESGISFRKKSDSKKIIVYRFCDHWTEITYLKSNLSDNELIELKSDENASLNMIGVIGELEKNNTKEYALELMNDLIKSENKFIAYGCSDAMSTKPIEQFFLYLMTEENFFFKPDFKLNKNDINRIENEILVANKDYWRN